MGSDYPTLLNISVIEVFNDDILTICKVYDFQILCYDLHLTMYDSFWKIKLGLLLL